MTQEQVLLLIKGMISTLDQTQQDNVRDLADTFRNMVSSNGAEGLLAISLVASELATA